MPEIQIPEKLLPIIATKARLIVIVGGRGSGKSESIARYLLMKAQTEQADILAGREYQNSIEDSVHKLLKGLVDTMGIQGFDITDKKINCTTGGGFRFRGFARNPEAVKSAQGFKYSWIEEADTISQKTIDDLLPTIRAAGSKLFFTANPQASSDPFSKRFITPYLKQLQRDGYYEDDMHLVIFCNYTENPWFPPELEQQRQWDYENKPRAEYLHIWEGAFNDSVPGSIIKTEWFDAAVDAHIKLGFKPRGQKVLSYDPSDEGSDSKAICFRHGSIILDAQEMETGDVAAGTDWALDYAKNHGADCFTWDCDGLGVALKRQVDTALEDTEIDWYMFKGSERVEDPDEICVSAEKAENIRTNKQMFKNKRAQYYARLRDRFYHTYQAVNKKVFTDPDKMISISSDIKCLVQMRSEICRVPEKKNGNGLFQIMAKPEMKKLGIMSPNIADSAMMGVGFNPPSKSQSQFRPQRAA